MKLSFRPLAVSPGAAFVVLVAALASSCSLNPIGEDPGINNETSAPGAPELSAPEPNGLVEEAGPTGIVSPGVQPAAPPAASVGPDSPDVLTDDGSIAIEPSPTPQEPTPPPGAPPDAPNPTPLPVTSGPEPSDDILAEPEPETLGGGLEAGPDIDGGVLFTFDGGTSDAAPPVQGAR